MMSVAREACPGCGFVWDDIDPNEVGPRLTSAIAQMGEVLGRDDVRVETRPSPERWSILEYAGHVRDVLWSIRERIILASVLDTPAPFGIYRDQRIDLGFQSLDEPSTVRAELDAARGIFVRTYAALPDGFGQRTMIYTFPVEAHRTIDWSAAQALHECEHHLTDIRDNVDLVNAPA